MANHNSTKKSIRKTVTRTLVNKSRNTRIKTYIKKVLFAVKSEDLSGAQIALTKAQSEIMKGVTNNIIKKNTASRRISFLSKKVKSLKG